MPHYYYKLNLSIHSDVYGVLYDVILLVSGVGIVVVAIAALVSPNRMVMPRRFDFRCNKCQINAVMILDVSIITTRFVQVPLFVMLMGAVVEKNKILTGMML